MHGIAKWEKRVLAKFSFYRRNETWDTLVKKKKERNCIKSYLTDMQEMFGLEYCP